MPKLWQQVRSVNRELLAIRFLMVVCMLLVIGIGYGIFSGQWDRPIPEYRDVPTLQVIPVKPDARDRFDLEFADWGSKPPECWEVLVESKFEHWVTTPEDERSRPIVCITTTRIEEPAQ